MPRHTTMRTYGLTLLSVLLCAILCPSCIYDKLDDTCGKPSITDGKCYMSLRFNLKKQSSGTPLTRTYEPTYEDEDYERKVSDFRIFLVDRNDPSAPVVELKDIPMVDKTTTEPFEIDPKWRHGYLLYVLANSGDSFHPDLSSGKAFRGTYEMGAAEACANLWKPNHFLMINVNNEASDMDLYKSESIDYEDKTPNGGVPIEIPDGKNYPYDNPYQAQVTLERVAAKIVVDCSQEDYDFSGYTYKGKFTDVRVDGVALLNSAHAFNLVQQWKIAFYKDVTAYKTEDSLKNFYELWHKYYEGSTWNWQPDDAPYGYHYLCAVTPQGDINSIPSQLYYSRLAEFTDFENQALREGADQLFTPLKSDKTLTFYCLENVTPLYLDFIKEENRTGLSQHYISQDNLAIRTCMRNRATAIVFQVRAKLKPDNHSTGDLIKDPDKGEWDKASTTQAESDDGYRTFYCYKTTVSFLIDEILRFEPELAEKGITASSSIKELRNAGVKVFEDGYMYYTHWIQDQNYKYLYTFVNGNDESEEFNYFGVLRNTRYELNVGSVNELGMDLPCRQVDESGNIIAEGKNYMLCPIPIKDSQYSNLKETIVSDLINDLI